MYFKCAAKWLEMKMKRASDTEVEARCKLEDILQRASCKSFICYLLNC